MDLRSKTRPLPLLSCDYGSADLDQRALGGAQVGACDRLWPVARFRGGRLLLRALFLAGFEEADAGRGTGGRAGRTAGRPSGLPTARSRRRCTRPGVLPSSVTLPAGRSRSQQPQRRNSMAGGVEKLLETTAAAERPAVAGHRPGCPDHRPVLIHVGRPLPRRSRRSPRPTITSSAKHSTRRHSRGRGSGCPVKPRRTRDAGGTPATPVPLPAATPATARTSGPVRVPARGTRRPPTSHD
jgi:hypothetical protein